MHVGWAGGRSESVMRGGAYIRPFRERGNCGLPIERVVGPAQEDRHLRGLPAQLRTEGTQDLAAVRYQPGTDPSVEVLGQSRPRRSGITGVQVQKQIVVDGRPPDQFSLASCPGVRVRRAGISKRDGAG